MSESLPRIPYISASTAGDEVIHMRHFPGDPSRSPERVFYDESGKEIPKPAVPEEELPQEEAE